MNIETILYTIAISQINKAEASELFSVGQVIPFSKVTNQAAKELILDATNAALGDVEMTESFFEKDHEVAFIARNAVFDLVLFDKETHTYNNISSGVAKVALLSLQGDNPPISRPEGWGEEE